MNSEEQKLLKTFRETASLNVCFISCFLYRPECEPVSCPPPPSVKDGQLTVMPAAVTSPPSSPPLSSPLPRLYGTLLQLTCRQGYRPQAGVTTDTAMIRCGADGTWSGTAALACRPSRCVPIQAPINGEVVFTAPQHSAEEEETESLVNTGTRATESLVSAGTRATESLVSAGTRAQFSCHDGYQLIGLVSSAICLQNQSWSGVTPQCQSKLNQAHVEATWLKGTVSRDWMPLLFH